MEEKVIRAADSQGRGSMDVLLPEDWQGRQEGEEGLKLRRLLQSRKFWAALVGLGLVVLKAFKPDFPLEEGQLTQLVWVLAAYIMGVALEDGLTAKGRPE